MPIDSLLASGVEALKHNHRAQARSIFLQAVRENPRSEQAWLLLGHCLEDPGQQVDCYRRALAINPSNAQARQELARLSRQAVPPAPVRPPVPSLAAPAEPSAAVPPAVLPQPRAVSEAVQPQQTPVPPTSFTVSAEEKPVQDAGTRPVQTPTPNAIRLSRLALVGGIALGFVLCLAPLAYLAWRFIPTRTAAVQPTWAMVQPAMDTPAPGHKPALSRTPPPFAIAGPTRTPGPAPIYAGPDISQLNDMVAHEQEAQAIPYLDQLIAAEPENALALYDRALAYWLLSKNNRTKAEYEDYVRQAREDIDQAILYSEYSRGLYYYVRYLIYNSMYNIEARRADRQRLGEVMLENLIQADALGDPSVSSVAIQRALLMQYFYMHRCEEGQAVLQYLLDENGPYAPPSVPMLYFQGQSAYCQGDLEKALEYLNQSLAIEPLHDPIVIHAEVLYMLGRYEEARQDLDGLIEAEPYYYGDRYYRRAAVQYALGNRQAAEADLRMGEANTWGRTGWRSYVLALMARDDGDTETATQYFQEALDTLTWDEYPLFDDIQAELAKLGAEPLPEEASLALLVTPLPSPQPTATRLATPASRLATQAAGGIVPPDSDRLELERGLPPYTYNNTIGKNYAMPVRCFATSKTVAIDTAGRLMFHLQPDKPPQPANYKFFLWNFHTGEWVMFRPGWGDIDFEDPGRFVTPQGEIYFYIRPDTDELTFAEMWVEIDATQTDGSPLHLGVDP